MGAPTARTAVDELDRMRRGASLIRSVADELGDSPLNREVLGRAREALADPVTADAVTAYEDFLRRAQTAPGDTRDAQGSPGSGVGA